MADRIFSRINAGLYREKWQIGLCRADISTIIRDKKFDPEINWINVKSLNRFHTDPFIIRTGNDELQIVYEDYRYGDYYGKISLMKVDRDFNIVSQNIILDTKSHLSYPFVFTEDNKTFLFPEASHRGSLLCYEYDPVKQALTSCCKIIDLPLLDSTILKYENKYWLFGTLSGKERNNKLYIFFSDSLFGPYTSHPGNPVKNSLIGCRPAGSFIRVGNDIYRPSQNCENFYGESISLNKIIELTESEYIEEPYMKIGINGNMNGFKNITGMHTINISGNVIVIDGLSLIYSPVRQIFNFMGRKFFKSIRRY